jgi:RecJ-like exonuclease
MATLECRKCHRAVSDCPTCKGRGRYSGTGTSTTCAGTGQVCPTHGKHWK